MNKSRYFSIFILIAEVGLLCMAGLFLRAFTPAAVLPRRDIPFLVLLSVIPLVLERYLCGEERGSRVFSAIMAGVIFAGFPLAVGLSEPGEMGRLLLGGGVTFLLTAAAYDAVSARGRTAAAPAVNGLMLFLASLSMMTL